MPFLRASRKKRILVFRNGVRMELDWTSYRKFRDLFEYLHDQQFRIETISNQLTVRKTSPKFSCSVPSFAFLLFFDFVLSLAAQNWIVEQINDSSFMVSKAKISYRINTLNETLYEVKSEKVTWIGPMDSLRAYFLECENGIYNYNYAGKTVLDVGGFCGETAVFFSSRGAKKVIIYEPVKAHHELIRKNIELNAIEAEQYEKGIGEKNESVTINYDTADWGFGNSSKGKNKITIEIKSTTEVIEESKADVAKIDCEGAEISLANVPGKSLATIKHYIVETHTKAIKDILETKFLRCGFTRTRRSQHLSGEIWVVYFEHK